MVTRLSFSSMLRAVSNGTFQSLYLYSILPFPVLSLLTLYRSKFPPPKLKWPQYNSLNLKCSPNQLY